MEDTTIIQSLVAVGGVSFIAALVQTIKPFISDGRWYPFIAIIFGLLINIGAAWALDAMTKVGIITAVLSGVMAGLAASGLYSLTQVGKQDVPKTTPPAPPATPPAP